VQDSSRTHPLYPEKVGKERTTCYLENGFIIQMKLIGDKFIVEKYGKPFLSTNVKHQFWGRTCASYSVDPKTNRVFIEDGCIDWIDPPFERPRLFKLQYSIRFDDDHVYDNSRNIIELDLDSNGNLLNQKEFYARKNPTTDTFNLTYDMGVKICTDSGQISDTLDFKGDLKFISREDDKYFGQYIFELYQRIKFEVIEGHCPKDCRYEKTYRKCRVDPWTATLLESHKYKENGHWWNGMGGSGENIRVVD
jgi:hypothetical protein